MSPLAAGPPAARPRQALARLPAGNLIVVSMPVWKIPAPILLRAIKSVLANTHRDLRLVMVSDGEARPSWEGIADEIMADPRIVRVHSPWNLGPYFNHDAVLRAFGGGVLFAIQDADDESHPQRFAKQLAMLRATKADACFSPIVNVYGARRRVGRPGRSVDGMLRHRADHFGLYNAAALLEIGGYHAGFRVGFDSVITSSMALLGHVCLTGDALYTRYRRGGSLTTSASTGHRSAFRKAQRAALGRFWREVFVAARVGAAAGARRHRQLSSARTKTLVNRRARVVTMIRAALAVPQPQAPVPEPMAPPMPATEIAQEAMPAADPAPLPAAIAPAAAAVAALPPSPMTLVKAIRAAPKSTWSISGSLARRLHMHCEATRPRQILDVGSGLSTFVLAFYASQHEGVRVVSLEHDRAWYERAHRHLLACGLRPHVDLRLCGLRSFNGAPCRYTWYDIDPATLFGPEGVDFVVVDGPPERDAKGRYGALWRAPGIIRPGTVIWLHDGLRDSERKVVRAWQKTRTMKASLSTVDDPRGVWHLEVQ